LPHRPVRSRHQGGETSAHKRPSSSRSTHVRACLGPSSAADQARHLWRARQKTKKAAVTEALARPAEESRTVSLGADKLFAMAEKHVSKSLPSWKREDIISEIVLGLLEGKIYSRNIAAKAKIYAAERSLKMRTVQQVPQSPTAAGSALFIAASRSRRSDPKSVTGYRPCCRYDFGGFGANERHRRSSHFERLSTMTGQL